jgi:hypothetical protein
LDISGHVIGGGILALSTYLLRSGARQGGHINRDAFFSGQPHCSSGLEHAEHTGTPAIEELNPSFEFPLIHIPMPTPIRNNRTARARIILGVNFKGMLDAIYRLLIIRSD